MLKNKYLRLKDLLGSSLAESVKMRSDIAACEEEMKRLRNELRSMREYHGADAHDANAHAAVRQLFNDMQRKPSCPPGQRHRCFDGEMAHAMRKHAETMYAIRELLDSTKRPRPAYKKTCPVHRSNRNAPSYPPYATPVDRDAPMDDIPEGVPVFENEAQLTNAR